MDQPLGCAVGNALEIREAIATLRGEGPPDFTELVLDAVSAAAVALRPRASIEAEGRAGAEQAVADGSAVAAYERWIRAQGGDPDESSACRRAPVVRQVYAAPATATSARIGADPASASPRSSSAPAARAKDDAIDHAVGVVCLRKRGDAVEAGEPLAEIHARDDAAAERAADAVRAALRARRRRARRAPILLDVVD